jgi:GT2 family glycosyltransferase
MVRPLSVSAVICTKDRLEEVTICVDSILKQSKLPSQLVIIDSTNNNSLESALLEMLKGHDLQLKYLNLDVNLTQARNAAVEFCDEDIVTYLDDDTVLGRDYFLEILKVFHSYKDQNIGGVSGNIVNGYQNKFRDLFSKLFFLFRYSDGKHRLSGIQTFVSKKVNKVIEVESLSGANMSLTRKVLEEISFDEDSPYCDDDDMSWRVSRKYNVFYTPFALIEHNPSLNGGGLGERSERWENEIEGLHNHFLKNIPNTFKHRMAFRISMLGLVINEMINILLFRKGSLCQLRGVIKAIIKL